MGLENLALLREQLQRLAAAGDKMTEKANELDGKLPEYRKSAESSPTNMAEVLERGRAGVRVARFPNAIAHLRTLPGRVAASVNLLNQTVGQLTVYSKTGVIDPDHVDMAVAELVARVRDDLRFPRDVKKKT